MQRIAHFLILIKCLLCAIFLSTVVQASDSIYEIKEKPKGHAYQGSYVGVAIGPGIITGNYVTDLSVNYSANIPHTFSYRQKADDDAIGAAGRISMGYGGCLFINCLYIGGEISVFKNTTDEVTEEFIESEVLQSGGGNNNFTLENEATASLDLSGAADLKVGILLSEEFMVYGIGGIVISQMKLMSHVSFSLAPNGTVNENEQTTQQTRGGFHVGLGIEQKIAQNTSMIVAYTYANYGSLEATHEVPTFTGGNFTGMLETTNKVTVTQQEAWVGVNYYF